MRRAKTIELAAACDCGGRCIVCALRALRSLRDRGRGESVVEDPVVTLEEVAAELGVTKERARQIEAVALAKMRRRIEILRKTRGSIEPLFGAWGERA